MVAELIIGVKRDPQFGLALVIGAGGILVEMVQDSAMLLLPTDRTAIEAAIDGLKISKLLKGYRGRPAGDLRAVADAVAAVARLRRGASRLLAGTRRQSADGAEERRSCRGRAGGAGGRVGRGV